QLDDTTKHLAHSTTPHPPNETTQRPGPPPPLQATDQKAGGSSPSERASGIAPSPAVSVLPRSGVQAHMLDAYDLPTFVNGDRVPDRHVVARQVQFMSARQWVVAGERVRECRDRVVQQVEDR